MTRIDILLHERGTATEVSALGNLASVSSFTRSPISSQLALQVHVTLFASMTIKTLDRYDYRFQALGNSILMLQATVFISVRIQYLKWRHRGSYQWKYITARLHSISSPFVLRTVIRREREICPASTLSHPWSTDIQAVFGMAAIHCEKLTFPQPLYSGFFSYVYRTILFDLVATLFTSLRKITK